MKWFFNIPDRPEASGDSTIPDMERRDFLKIGLLITGVFAGGVAWSCLYVRYGSVWPGYLSHAIVDVAVFGTGAALLFG